MDQIRVKTKLNISQEEFQEIFAHGQYRASYSVAVKKLLYQKLKFSVKANKKKILKKSLKIDLNCVKCKAHASITVDKDYATIDPVPLVVESACLHSIDGKVI